MLAKEILHQFLIGGSINDKQIIKIILYVFVFLFKFE